MDCAIIDSLHTMQVSSQVENDLGILIPPPDMRTTVEKVAKFVASIKPRLERVIGENAGMRDYTFRNVSDPYHAYYQQLLSKFRAQNGLFTDEPEVSDDEPNIFQQAEKMFEQHEDSVAVNNTIVVSPITGDLITVNSMSQHMQDPKYTKQKEKLFAKIREIKFAQDDEILKSLISVAKKRPDVFGTTEEMVVKAVIKHIDPCLILDDGCLDESLLVPEHWFLAESPVGPACISVLVPGMNGMPDITVESLSESVGSFKEKVAKEIAVPANKLKLELVFMPGHFKDNLSLAYYNVGDGDLLSVSW